MLLHQNQQLGSKILFHQNQELMNQAIHVTLKLAMVVVCNSNNEIPPNIDWEFQ